MENNNIRLSCETAKKEITYFKQMLETLLEQSYGDDAKMEQLYEQDFIISFGSQSCRIAFGANEYYSMLEMLENILEDL